MNVCKYNPAQYRCCVYLVGLTGSFVLIFRFNSGLHLHVLFQDQLFNRKEQGTEQPFPLHLHVTASSSVGGGFKVKD